MTDITVNEYATANHAIPALPLRAWEVTPSDTANYTKPVSVQVTVAGDVKVLPWNGSNDGAETPIVLPAGMCVAGFVLPFRVKRIYSNGTSATLIGIF